MLPEPVVADSARLPVGQRRRHGNQAARRALASFLRTISRFSGDR